MASGDVIRLSHALEDPLILSTDAQADFCAGHLVQRAGRPASHGPSLAESACAIP